MILALLLIAGFTACSQPSGKATTTKDSIVASDGRKFPSPQGGVSDYEHLFDAAQKQSLATSIESFHNKKDCWIVITSIAPRVAEEEFDQYCIDLFNAWGVGEKGKNNGLLIAISASQRRMRITTGRGIETRYDDEKAKMTVQLMLTFLKTGQYYEGVVAGMNDILLRME